MNARARDVIRSDYLPLPDALYGAIAEHVCAIGLGEARGPFLDVNDARETMLASLCARRFAAVALDHAEDALTELLVLEERHAAVKREIRRLLGIVDRYGELCVLAARRTGTLLALQPLADLEDWEPDPIRTEDDADAEDTQDTQDAEDTEP